jgi:hypothetical protein
VGLPIGKGVTRQSKVFCVISTFSSSIIGCRGCVRRVGRPGAATGCDHRATGCADMLTIDHKQLRYV